MASVPTSFFFAVMVVLACSVPLSSGFVMLETVADITGWTNRTCVYANEYTDMEYAECRVPITSDNERNDGYWSHCGNSACRLTYTVKAGDDPITAIRVRAYLVPNDAVDSPIIRITYKDENFSSKWVEFPVEDGWVALEHEFTLNLGPGSTIEVRQTGYWEGGKDFAMVDRIILSNGLDEPIPTPSTVPPTIPPSTSPTTNIPTTTTTQRSTTTKLTTTTTITPTTRRSTTPYTIPPPIPDEILLDREDVPNGWSANCEYDDDYFYLEERCGSVVGVPALIGSGYWSNCVLESCSLSFDITTETPPTYRDDESYGLIGVEVRMYMNTGSIRSPLVQIMTTNEVGTAKTYNFPTVSGWNKILMPVDTLKPNSRIDIRLMSNHSAGEFVMVDKIVLKFGIPVPEEVEDDDPGLSILQICLIVLAGVLLLVIIIIICTCAVRKMRPNYARMDESEMGSETGQQQHQQKRQIVPTHVSRIPDLAHDFRQDQEIDLRAYVDSAIIIPRAFATPRSKYE